MLTDFHLLIHGTCSNKLSLLWMLHHVLRVSIPASCLYFLYSSDRITHSTSQPKKNDVPGKNQGLNVLRFWSKTYCHFSSTAMLYSYALQLCSTAMLYSYFQSKDISPIFLWGDVCRGVAIFEPTSWRTHWILKMWRL